jgi:hypothetical protein
MAYEDVENLQPCLIGSSRKFWFDGSDWICSTCVRPPHEKIIRVKLLAKCDQLADASRTDHTERSTFGTSAELQQ